MKNPGKLQHKAAIYQPVEGGTPDAKGDEQLTYSLFATVWCSIEPLSGREFQLAQQQFGNVTHKIGMRYIDGLTKRMHLSWNGRQFNLGPPFTPEERRFELNMLALEVV